MLSGNLMMQEGDRVIALLELRLPLNLLLLYVLQSLLQTREGICIASLLLLPLGKLTLIVSDRALRRLN
ncbi:hypothetical protein H6F43_21760 [Leptolyngbya sp. FACHB-36]|uniref:hypothetical protein n=1 Tax=Leptolyngbya sp. FACHB-36 TaxID=2692808 RepID=UPI00168085D3|nr:hypothetical protein [Leptolyngbya sp. FACHB-36]MBD2022813.1 hypothetical protein [Leptolyngbya sp. FACHB-36]